ncbi:MAG: hypothetical protein QXI27_06835 [Nitrososphaerota archaeon]
MRIGKARLSEDLASCDRCRARDIVGRFYLVQVGPEHHQYVEVCAPCLSKLRRK